MLARGRPASVDQDNGGLTILTANITALRPKAALVAKWGADITLLQETKVSPAVVGFVKTAFSDQQKTLYHGQLCRTAERRAAKVASSAREAAKGGVAIAVARPREAAKADDTALSKELRSTGRWEEVLVPAGKATTHFGAATIYGVSGASKDSRCHRENEALLAKAVLRVIEAGDLPYVLAGDINVNPAESEVIASAVEAGILVDLGHAARSGEAPEPTFRRSGPFEGMTEDDVATSRIDVILANPTAAASVASFRPRWDLVVGDHVPLEAKFSVGAYAKDVCRYDGPKPINVDDIPSVHQDVQHSAYLRARALFGRSLDDALARRDVDKAHAAWCNMAEAYIEILRGRGDDDVLSMIAGNPSRASPPRLSNCNAAPSPPLPRLTPPPCASANSTKPGTASLRCVPSWRGGSVPRRAIPGSWQPPASATSPNLRTCGPKPGLRYSG